MTQETATIHPINPAAAQQQQPLLPGQPLEPPPQKAKPTKILPTTRTTVAKQLDMLRAYVAASGTDNKAVKVAQVANVGKISNATVSLTNGFLLDTGLIQKTDGGVIPAPESIAFSRAYEWDKERAAHKLAPLIAKTWFAIRLLPQLSYDRLAEAEAIQDLATEAGATKEYRNEVRSLIDYMEAVGLIVREGDFLKLVKNVSAHAPPPPPAEKPAEQPATASTEKDRAPAQEPPRSVGVATAFTQSAGGVIQFNISVKLDIQEFSTWQPENIAAFFSGMAAVLAAKAAVEKEAGIA
jgi:hypothetical protein